MSDSSKPITLVATIGSSPAVLTEAIYALYSRELWPVTRVEIITTSHGAQRIREELYGPNGALIRLCNEYGLDPFAIGFPKADEVTGEKDSDGNVLNDIRNSKDDTAMAAHIQRIVRRLTTDDDIRVFGLLSGGRKTMSSHLMSAMQLFSRRDDKLFHILVPHPFELIDTFYYPTRTTLMLPFKQVGSDTADHYDASCAQIDLIDIPYIRLRSFLETEMDYSKDYDELIAEADQKLLSRSDYPVHDLHIHLNGENSALFVNGAANKLRLEPRQISMLTLFVWKNIMNGSPRDLTWKELMKDQDAREVLHRFYRTAKEGNYHGLQENIRKLHIDDLNEIDVWLSYEYWFDDNDRPLKRSFAKHKSILARDLNTFLQNNFATSDLRSEHIIISHGRGQAVDKVNRVPVPVEKCRITGLHEKDAEILGLDVEESQ